MFVSEKTAIVIVNAPKMKGNVIQKKSSIWKTLLKKRQKK